MQDWPVAEGGNTSQPDDAPNSKKLWAIVCPSVGEVFAMESLGDALSQAAECNAEMAMNIRSEFSPPLSALMTVVMQWDGSPEDHAKNIAEWKSQEVKHERLD